MALELGRQCGQSKQGDHQTQAASLPWGPRQAKPQGQDMETLRVDHHREPRGLTLQPIGELHSLCLHTAANQ